VGGREEEVEIVEGSEIVPTSTDSPACRRGENIAAAASPRVFETDPPAFITAAEEFWVMLEEAPCPMTLSFSVKVVGRMMF